VMRVMESTVNGTRLALRRGDITSASTDAFVNAANPGLTDGGAEEAQASSTRCCVFARATGCPWRP
jgi:hypothetical protein